MNSMASLVITASTNTGREERKKRGGVVISHQKENILQSKE